MTGINWRKIHFIPCFTKGKSKLWQQYAQFYFTKIDETLQLPHFASAKFQFNARHFIYKAMFEPVTLGLCKCERVCKCVQFWHSQTGTVSNRNCEFRLQIEIAPADSRRVKWSACGRVPRTWMQASLAHSKSSALMSLTQPVCGFAMYLLPGCFHACQDGYSKYAWVQGEYKACMTWVRNLPFSYKR